MRNSIRLRLVLIAVLLNGELTSAFLYSEWFDDLTRIGGSTGILKPSQAYQSLRGKHQQEKATRPSPAMEKLPSDKFADKSMKLPTPHSRITFRDYQRLRDAQRTRRLASWEADADEGGDARAKEKAEGGEATREKAERERATETSDSSVQEGATTRLREDWEEMERMVRENERENIRKMEENADLHHPKYANTERVEEDSGRLKRRERNRLSGTQEFNERRLTPDHFVGTVEDGQSGQRERRETMGKRSRVVEEGRPGKERSADDMEGEEGRTHSGRKPQEREESLGEKAEWKRRNHNYQKEHNWEERSGISEGDRGKPSATIFPYNAVAGIVSIIWLVNILFIAWLVFGRENHNNMRIPGNFEYKPPVKVVHSRGLHLNNEEEHNEGAGDSGRTQGNLRETLEANPPTLSSSPISPSTLQKTSRPWSSLKPDSPQDRPSSPSALHFPSVLPAPDTTLWSPKKLQPEDFSSYSGRPSLAPRVTDLALPYSPVTGEHDRDYHAFTKTPRSYASHVRPVYEEPFTGRHRDLKGKYFSETERYRVPFLGSNTHDPFGGTTRLRISHREKDLYKSSNTPSRYTNYNVSKHENSEENIAEKSVSETSAEPLKYPQSRDRTDREDAERRERERKETSKAEKVSGVQWKDKCVHTRAQGSRENNVKAKSSRESKSASAGVEVFDIKEFISLPNEILDALACTNTGKCQHDHSKYRIVGDKLYFLSVGSQDGSTEVSSTVMDGRLPLSHKTLPNKQHNSSVVAPDQNTRLEKIREGGGLHERARHSVALSPIPQDVSTQITPEVYHKRLVCQQAATASATTQCPSSFMVADTMQKHLRKLQCVPRKEAARRHSPSADAVTFRQTQPIVLPQEKAQSECYISHLANKVDTGSFKKPYDQETLHGPGNAGTEKINKSQWNLRCSESNSYLKNKMSSEKNQKECFSDVQQTSQPILRTSDTKPGASQAEDKVYHSPNRTLVAPPPFGYHIRKDYSSSESAMEVVDKRNARAGGSHLHTVPGIAKSKETQQNEKKYEAIAMAEAHGKVESHKIKCKRHGQNEVCHSISKVHRGHGEDEDKNGEDTTEGEEGIKNSKKLMIIGKLNYFNVSRRSNDKSDSKAALHFGVPHHGDHDIEDGRNKRVNKAVHKTPKCLSLRHKTPQEMTVGVPSECLNACGEGYAQDKNLEDFGYLPLSQESPVGVYDSVFYSEKNAKRYQPKNKQSRSSRFLSHNIKSWKRLAKDKKKRSPPYAFNNGKLKAKFGPRQADKRHLLSREMAKDMEYTSENADFLPSYHLNVNTNAGIIDNCGDDPRADTKQMSSTSVHSNDQFYSTHTDTPEGRNIDSDAEVSQSFSFTDDMDKLVASKPLEHDIMPNIGDSQERQIAEDWEEKKQNIMQACNEAIKNRLQRRHIEHSLPEKYIAFDKQPEKSPQNIAIVAPSETPPATGSKPKNKTKTTEALYFKFESSMSKKVTTTTVVKDGRKIHQSRPKQEQQRQLSAGEAPRAITGPQDKGDKKCAMEMPRHTKIIRCNENAGEKPKQKQSSDTNIESPESKELVRQSKPAVRSAESGHRNTLVQDIINSTCKSDDVNYVKQIICWPSKDMPPLESPEAQLSSRGHSETRADIADSDKASEKASSVITVVHLLPSQTSLQREAANRELQAKEIHATIYDNKSDKSESPCSPKSPPADKTLRKKVRTKSKGETSSRKSSPEPGSKQNTKPRKPAIKNKGKPAEETSKEATSDEGGEGMKLKVLQQQILAARKKSPLRKKLHSRSPDMKKKRRSAKKREPHADSKGEDISANDSKADKSKKQKSGEKSSEKKKRKRKVSSYSDDEAYLGDIKQDKTSSTPRSKSSDTQKATQTASCSAFSPRFMDSFLQNVEKNKTGSPVWQSQSKDSEDKEKGGKEKTVTGDEAAPSTDKESLIKTRDHRIKNMVASAENVSIVSSSGMQIRSAESIPAFTGNVCKTPTKVVQVPSCPSGRKSEKDLQQAEMGWNSSMLSEASKAAAEKAKNAQKRSKIRYYLVKPKPKQTEWEVGASKLKRSAIQISNAEGDGGACSGNDLDLKNDVYPKEKNGTGQGKSVQFSDSIEELEASKIDIQCDSSASPERHDMLEDWHKTGNPVIDEALYAEMEGSRQIKAESSKLESAKKEPEQKTHNTTSRRKRPVWLKKSSNSQAHADSKDGKSKMGSKSNKNTMIQSKNALVNAGLPLKMRHSTDNLIKPDSRFNFHVYYPIKPTCGSPKTSNISLNEKRAVAYNTWINSIFLAAPLNKATKKLVAKIGSPVDIKEIIEGSSVDAADHFRMMRSLQEASLRSAKSVPALGPSRPQSVNVSGGKQVKSQKANKAIPAKKQKETKPQESGSSRSLSSVAVSEDSMGSATQVEPINRNVPMGSTFALPTDAEEATGCKSKGGLNRRIPVSRRRDKKHSKRSIQPMEEAVDWQLVAGQDMENSQALNRMHYYGDMELNVLNMGVAWMVQSVFNRLSFLSPRNQEPAGQASGDMTSNQQIIE